MADKQHMGDGNDDMVLKPDLNITYDHKSSLKRSEETGIGLEDEKAIAMMEGDSGLNDGSADLSMLYAKTKLQPDHDVVFPDVASLKKRVIIIPVAIRYAAAAIILLLISIGTWFVQKPELIHERMQYELANLESIRPEFKKHYQHAEHLTYRQTGGILVSQAQREMVYIDKIEGTYNDNLILSTTLSSSQTVLYPRQSNIQHPTSTPPAYAQAEPKKKTLLGKVLSGIFSKAKSPFEGNIPSSESESSDGFLWNLAELGMKGVNAMGDHDYTVVRYYNDKGNVKGLIVLEE